jgi:hypothetical protein
MQYCTICKSNQDSWADKGRSGSNYENRCWKCDNYSLSSSSIVSAEQKVSAATALKLASQAGLEGELEYRIEQGNKYTGDYRSESLRYRR